MANTTSFNKTKFVSSIFNTSVDAMKIFQAARNMGVVASRDNCDKAIIELTQRGLDLETAPNAFEVLKLLSQAILPSVELCQKALEEIKPAANSQVH